MKQVMLYSKRLKTILYAKVDDEDFERLNEYKWGFYRSTRGTVYAYTHIKGKITKMHQIVLQNFNSSIDHIDGDGLNNQKFNLRLANSYQSAWNTKKRKDAVTSKFKGVYYNRDNDCWRARITFKHRTIEVGSFNTEKQAAFAYNRKAKELFGEFAKLNIIED